jgi:hypothetical protein
MPNCKEVARLVASDELADAVWSDRALVRLHLLMCRHCRGYAAQLRAIGAAARDRSDLDPADRASFEKLQSSILERCLDASDVNTEDGSDRDPESPAEPTDPR